MKKISILATFLFAVLFSSSALAANWVDVAEYMNSTIYVDKDSIRRGIYSTQYNYKSSDGFSAHIKFEGTNNSGEYFCEIYLIGFWTEDGEKKFVYLEKFDEYGNLIPSSYTTSEPLTIKRNNNDSYDNGHWLKIWNYVERNLP